MSKIKQAQELLENIGIEWNSSQLYQLEQAIKVEQALGKQQEPTITYRSGISRVPNPIFESETHDD